MNVVGHNDETAAEPTVTLWAVEQEACEALKSDFIVEHPAAAIHAHRQQIRDVAVPVRPNAMQSAQVPGRRFGVAARDFAVCIIVFFI
ncbi:MAG: hypothetical protein ABSH34_34690, partial [Verrucomicrobiota bacterium]